MKTHYIIIIKCLQIGKNQMVRINNEKTNKKNTDDVIPWKNPGNGSKEKGLQVVNLQPYSLKGKVR
jgi:hypothetical protein